MNIDPYLYALSVVSELPVNLKDNITEFSLVASIYKRDAYTTNQLLPRANIHWRGESALIAATSVCNVDLVSRLIRLGADAKTSSDMPLKIAAKHGHVSLARMLSKHSSPEGVHAVLERGLSDRMNDAIAWPHSRPPSPVIQDIVEVQRFAMEEIKKIYFK